MIRTYFDNIQFYILAFIWLIAGMYSGLVAFAIIPLFLLLLYRGDRYKEIFMGFLFILVLSDSLEPGLVFAKSFKNINILLLAMFFLMDYKSFIPANRLFIYFVPFFLVAIVCLVFSGPILNTAAQKTLSYVLLFVLVPTYVERNFKDSGVVFLKELLLFILLLVVAGYFFKYISPQVAFSHGGRLRGVFGNPNGLGIFMILFFILFYLVNNYFPDLFNRWEKAIIVLIIFFITYKTGSRTALVAIFLFLLFIQIFKFSMLLGFVTFLAALLATEYWLVNYEKIITSLGLGNVLRVDTLGEGSGRLIAWQFAWQNIQRSIFLGNGFSYDEHLMRSNFEYLSKQGHEGGVHNTYLILWLNTGLIGLIAFLRGFFLMFIKAAKNTPIAFPAMMTIMFSINFEPWLAASLNPFTILFLTIITIMTSEVFQEVSQKMKAENEEINHEETPQVA